jgi:hypothetical protein
MQLSMQLPLLTVSLPKRSNTLIRFSQHKVEKAVAAVVVVVVEVLVVVEVVVVVVVLVVVQKK